MVSPLGFGWPLLPFPVGWSSGSTKSWILGLLIFQERVGCPTDMPRQGPRTCKLRGRQRGILHDTTRCLCANFGTRPHPRSVRTQVQGRAAMMIQIDDS